MRREPEIVKILREEERLRNSQAQTNSYNRPLVTSDEETTENADESTVLYIPSSKSPETFPADFLQTVYRTAFELVPFAILILDTHQRIVSCNAYTESFLGKTNQELYQKPISVLHSPEEWQNIKKQLDDQPGLQHQIKTTILLKDNRRAEVMIQSCALKNSKGDDFGYLYLIKNNLDQGHPGHQIDSLLQDTENSIFLVDATGQYLMINNQSLSLLGRPREDVLGRTFSDFHSYEETKEFFEKLSWVFENGTPRNDVYHIHDKWLVRTINPIREPSSSQTTFALVIMTEMNQKALTGDKTLDLEKKYATLFNRSPQGTLLVDQKGTIVEVNERITEWTGYSSEEITTKALSDLPVFTKESKKSLQKIFSKRYANKTIPPFDIELQTKHRGKQAGLVSVSHLSDDQGNETNYLITISEYSKHTHRNDALRIKDKSITALGESPTESERRFQVVLENSLDMIYQIDQKKGTYDYVSPSSIKIIGYTPKEIHSFTLKNMEEMIHPEDVARWNQHLQMITDQQQKQNAIRSIEYRFNHKTRGYRWIRDTCTALFDGKNEPVSIIGTIEDITDRKKVWEELVKSEEKYRILAETSADGVFTTDPLGRLTYVNPSFEKLCRRRKSQILATPFRNYLLEDSVYFFQQIFIDVRKKNDKIENVELELVAGDGNITPIEANIAPLTKQTEFGGVVCTVRDITQRREIEDELKKNERLKTEFMNIAAHELRSPVTPIKGYLDLIIHDNESDQKIKNWAKISLRNAERLLKLVNDILDVSRLDSDTMRFDMEKIDLVELLNEIVEDMKPAIVNKKLEFHVNIPAPLPHIIGDKNRLSQVLKNLIGNSLKFTDCGYIGLGVEKKDNHVLITVEDTGIGISKDELKKIFTKFYQAYTGEDRNNEGTGLGLFISKEIVKKHNGEIWAESEVGKGSRFIIQLPYIYKMVVDFKT